MKVTELPFNRLIGVQFANDPTHLLRLPAGEQYLNHVGTVHASAQLALAEAASGEFLLRHFTTLDNLIPVVRRMDAKFRKPANGSIISSVTLAEAVLAQLDSELSAKGRALISIPVEIHDESGVHTMSATFEWFIQYEKRS